VAWLLVVFVSMASSQACQGGADLIAQELVLEIILARSVYVIPLSPKGRGSTMAKRKLPRHPERQAAPGQSGGEALGAQRAET
jgi:hypothetical protein